MANKLKIKNFRDVSQNKMILVTFDSDKLFLKNYKNILKEIGLEIKSDKNPLHRNDLSEGLDFSSVGKFDVEIIYFANFIAFVVRYSNDDAKNLFMRSLYRYAE